MLQLPSISGPQDARSPSIPRAPGSVRRTSTIDTRRPEGLPGPALVDARARDLWTGPDGSTAVVEEARLALRLDDPGHQLVSIEATPSEPALDTLIGAIVGPGFRRKVDRAAPHLAGTGGLLSLLLDDLPGAALVSGYAKLHAGVIGDGPHDEYLVARGDLCAGWAVEGSMMRAIREYGRTPTPLGPSAPPVQLADDPAGWHALDPLGRVAMRRLRRLDLVAPTKPGGAYVADVFFRDSHVDGEGDESVVHEYALQVSFDAASRRVISVEADADVLPWRECPAALASAPRIVGLSLAELRPWIREHMSGVSTCTHLNDVLRGLADLDHLATVVELPTADR